jgi:hypothetical protein
VAIVVSEVEVKIEPRLDILTSLVAKVAHEDVAVLDVDSIGGEMEGHDVCRCVVVVVIWVKLCCVVVDRGVMKMEQ